MKASVLQAIPRTLIGLVFVIFGLNFFLHFIPIPPAEGAAAQFMGAIYASKFLLVVKVLEIVGGVFLIANIFPRVGIAILTPIIVNIFLYHLLIVKAGAFQLPFVLIILTVLHVLLDKEALPFLLRKK